MEKAKPEHKFSCQVEKLPKVSMNSGINGMVMENPSPVIKQPNHNDMNVLFQVLGYSLTFTYTSSPMLLSYVLLNMVIIIAPISELFFKNFRPYKKRFFVKKD